MRDNYGQVTAVLLKLPVLSIVTCQHCPLGDFNINPLELPFTYISPLDSSNFSEGVDVPMPTFPSESILIFSVLDVLFVFVVPNIMYDGELKLFTEFPTYISTAEDTLY